MFCGFSHFTRSAGRIFFIGLEAKINVPGISILETRKKISF
jgi:hypothetical protein